MIITDADIVEAMALYGGSFIVALANAYHHADAINRERVKVAFSDYWERYRELVALRAARL